MRTVKVICRYVFLVDNPRCFLWGHLFLNLALLDSERKRIVVIGLIGSAESRLLANSRFCGSQQTTF